jgi:signal transduction histidine kinase
VSITGPPRELGSEARLAVYRTAQEALTNVLRHSAAERVELLLAYEADGTRLVVRDHGPGAPVAVGSGGPSGGYGLTGMRERAELLGGRLRAELWLPA